jgi:hypothetical protein
VIQFDPRDGEAGGKQVRNITVQQNGFGPYAVRVSATVWPSHSHIALAKGDVVTFEGPYTKNTTTNDDGEERTFHNISVTRLKNHGPVDEGTRDDAPRSQPAAAEVADDDIPF